MINNKAPTHFYVGASLIYICLSIFSDPPNYGSNAPVPACPSSK